MSPQGPRGARGPARAAARGVRGPGTKPGGHAAGKRTPAKGGKAGAATAAKAPKKAAKKAAKATKASAKGAASTARKTQAGKKETSAPRRAPGQRAPSRVPRAPAVHRAARPSARAPARSSARTPARPSARATTRPSVRTPAAASSSGAPPAAPFTVFLDRDGVLNENPRIQVRRWARFRWLPGVPEALARLNRPDVQVALVTNQPATALGFSTPRQIARLHAQMLEGVREAGGRIDRIEVCFAPPFWPARRRKPRAGMVEDAAAAFEAGAGFDPRRAVFVGDKLKDAQAAAAFGIPCILLATTHDAHALEARTARLGVPYLAIVPGLPEAVELILSFVAEAQP